MTGWVKITCEDREQLVDRLGRSYNGLAGPEFGVVSSRTDLGGEFGDPIMETVWGRRTSEEPVLRDVRHPPLYDRPLGDPPQPDSKPCEHYRYDASCPTCGEDTVWFHSDGDWSWVCNGPKGCGYGDMSSPRRIQLRRNKGWRKPEGAIVVARPSKWGNPFKVGMVVNRAVLGHAEHRYTIDITVRDRGHAVDCYRRWLNGTPLLVGGHDLAPLPPTAAEIRGALASHDLACWCPLDQPCHADVLLELANGGQP